MKKISLITGLFLVAAGAFFFSCKRELTLKDSTTSPAGSAMIRIVDASPNFRKIFNQPDTFNVLFNGQKVSSYTPGTALVMTYNSIYPFSGTNYGYVAVPAGSQSIALTLGVNKLDSVVILSFKETLAPDQYYSFLITDSVLNASKDSSRVFIRDTIPQPTIGYYYLRFINTAFNDTAAVDIWSTRANRTIFNNIKPGGVVNFTQQPYNATYNDTLFVRRVNTLIGLDTLGGAGFSNQRAYTLVYKGDALNNVTSNVKRRHLAFYLNK